MRTIFQCILVAVCFAAASIQAEDKPPPGFPAFWQKFQTAVAKDEKEAVADMSVLPFWWGASLDRSGFLKAYPKIFDAKTKACFKNAKAVEEAPFQNVFCGRMMYRFGLNDGAWRLIEAADND